MVGRLVWTRTLLNTVLSLPTLRYLGERSYSVYLWHYFVGVALIARSEEWQGLLVFAIQVAASLVVSIAAYEWLELPARKYLNALIARRGGHRTAATA